MENDLSGFELGTSDPLPGDAILEGQTQRPPCLAADV
jgi:hypothetical protein